MAQNQKQTQEVKEELTAPVAVAVVAPPASIFADELRDKEEKSKWAKSRNWLMKTADPVLGCLTAAYSARILDRVRLQIGSGRAVAKIRIQNVQEPEKTVIWSATPTTFWVKDLPEFYALCKSIGGTIEYLGADKKRMRFNDAAFLQVPE